VVSKLKERTKVREEKLLIGALADDFYELLVHLDLVFLPLFIRLELLGFRLEDVSAFGLLRLLLLVVSSDTLEVLVVDGLGDLNLRDVELSACHDGKHLVHSTNRAAIDDVRPGYEKKTAWKGLQHDDTLSFMSTGKNDDNSTGFNASLVCSSVVLVGNVSRLALLDGSLSRIETALFLYSDKTLATILVATNWLFDTRGFALKK